jgi:hypothetical protein
MISDREIGRFYRLYRLSLLRAGVEPRPVEHFVRLHKVLGDLVHFAVATVDGRDASASAFADFGGTLTIMYGGYDHDLRRTNAASYLDDWAVEWAIGQGCKQVDLGPSANDEGDGSYQFKKRFGGRIVPIYRHERLVSRKNWIASRLSRAPG